MLQIRARDPNGETLKHVEILVTEPDGHVKRKKTGDNGIANVAINLGNVSGDIDILVKAKDQTLGDICKFHEFCSPCSQQITVKPKFVGKIEVHNKSRHNVCSFYRYTT